MNFNTYTWYEANPSLACFIFHCR